MIRPAFNKEALNNDVKAILRRTNIVVNTPTDLDVRFAGSAENGDDVVVRRVPLGNQRLITNEAKEKLRKWTESGEFPPQAEFAKAIAKEQRMFRSMFKDAKVRNHKANLRTTSINFIEIRFPFSQKQFFGVCWNGI